MFSNLEKEIMKTLLIRATDDANLWRVLRQLPSLDADIGVLANLQAALQAAPFEEDTIFHRAHLRRVALYVTQDARQESELQEAAAVTEVSHASVTFLTVEGITARVWELEAELRFGRQAQRWPALLLAELLIMEMSSEFGRGSLLREPAVDGVEMPLALALAKASKELTQAQQAEFYGLDASMPLPVMADLLEEQGKLTPAQANAHRTI